MAKQTWLKVNNEWVKAKSAWIKEDGEWKKNTMPKGVVEGDWREFMQYDYLLYSIYDNIKTDPTTSKIQCHRQDLSLVWETIIPYADTIDIDQNYIYVGSRSLIKIHKLNKSNGSIVWSVTPTIPGTPLDVKVKNNGEIIVGYVATAGYLRLDSNGVEITKKARTAQELETRPEIDVDGNIYIKGGRNDNTRIQYMYKYDATSLDLLFNASVTKYGDLYDAVGVDKNQNLHLLQSISNQTINLKLIDKITGDTIKLEAISSYYRDRSHPLVFDSQYIYALTGEKFHKFDSNYNIIATYQWHYTFSDPGSKGFDISPDGDIYIKVTSYVSSLAVWETRLYKYDTDFNFIDYTLLTDEGKFKDIRIHPRAGAFPELW